MKLNLRRASPPRRGHDELDYPGLERLLGHTINVTKSALSLMGICQDQFVEPFDQFFGPKPNRVRATLEEHFSGSPLA